MNNSKQLSLMDDARSLSAKLISQLYVPMTKSKIAIASSKSFRILSWIIQSKLHYFTGYEYLIDLRQPLLLNDWNNLIVNFEFDMLIK